MSTPTTGLEAALHATTRVLPGKKVIISTPQLAEGLEVEVFLVMSRRETALRRSMLDHVESLPGGPRSAATWEDLERNFQEERDSWAR